MFNPISSQRSLNPSFARRASPQFIDDEVWNDSYTGTDDELQHAKPILTSEMTQRTGIEDQYVVVHTVAY